MSPCAFISSRERAYAPARVCVARARTRTRACVARAGAGGAIAPFYMGGGAHLNSLGLFVGLSSSGPSHEAEYAFGIFFQVRKKKATPGKR